MKQIFYSFFGAVLFPILLEVWREFVKPWLKQIRQGNTSATQSLPSARLAMQTRNQWPNRLVRKSGRLVLSAVAGYLLAAIAVEILERTGQPTISPASDLGLLLTALFSIIVWFVVSSFGPMRLTSPT